MAVVGGHPYPLLGTKSSGIDSSEDVPDVWEQMRLEWINDKAEAVESAAAEEKQRGQVERNESSSSSSKGKHPSTQQQRRNDEPQQSFNDEGRRHEGQKRKAPWQDEQRKSDKKTPKCIAAATTNEVKEEDYGNAMVHPLVPTQFFPYAASDSDEAPTEGEDWWTGVESQMQHDKDEEQADSREKTLATNVEVCRRIRCKRPPKPNEVGGRRTRAKRPG